MQDKNPSFDKIKQLTKRPLLSIADYRPNILQLNTVKQIYSDIDYDRICYNVLYE